MPSTWRDILDLLIERGLIEPSRLLEDRFIARDRSRRNAALEIEQSGEAHSIFAKWPREHDEFETLANESHTYSWLHEYGGAFAAHVPPLLLFDAPRRVLVLGLVEGARSMRAVQLDRGRFSRRSAGLVGDALAKLHALPITARADLPWRRSTPPWIFSLARANLELWWDASPANLQLISIVQRVPSFGESLFELNARWRPRVVIHGDFKWDNLLVRRDSRRVWIVDWELAKLGDPAWDAGTYLADYLSAWLMSVPSLPGKEPSECLPEAGYPVERMWPAMREFWSAYTEGLRLSRPEAAELLLDTVRCAAARLVQCAYEQSQHAIRLSSRALYLLQVGQNMLARPAAAASHLLALGPEPALD